MFLLWSDATKCENMRLLLKKRNCQEFGLCKIRHQYSRERTFQSLFSKNEFETLPLRPAYGSNVQLGVLHEVDALLEDVRLRHDLRDLSRRDRVSALYQALQWGFWKRERNYFEN